MRTSNGEERIISKFIGRKNLNISAKNRKITSKDFLSLLILGWKKLIEQISKLIKLDLISTNKILENFKI